MRSLNFIIGTLRDLDVRMSVMEEQISEVGSHLHIDVKSTTERGRRGMEESCNRDQSQVKE
jgi:hypothetical protein